MGWIKQKSAEHGCKKPSWSADVSKGDIWQCDDCQTKWAVTDIQFEDRPCGAVRLQWRKFDG